MSDKENKKEPTADAVKPKKEPKAGLGNEHYFLTGEVVEVKGMKYICKEVRGVELILARKDFK